MVHVVECPDHTDCDLIQSDGWPDQPGSWASHFANDVPPEARLNPDDPAQAEIEDRRSSTATEVLARRAPNEAESDRLAGRRPPKLTKAEQGGQ